MLCKYCKVKLRTVIDDLHPVWKNGEPIILERMELLKCDSCGRSNISHSSIGRFESAIGSRVVPCEYDFFMPESG